MREHSFYYESHTLTCTCACVRVWLRYNEYYTTFAQYIVLIKMSESSASSYISESPVPENSSKSRKIVPKNQENILSGWQVCDDVCKIILYSE